MLAQVPHTTLMLTSFSVCSNFFEQQEKFHRLDDVTFLFKFLSRFGPLTVATTLATVVCYPLDTVKRRLQVEGSRGYQNSEVFNEFRYARNMMQTEGIKSFYRGFSLALATRVPLTFI